MKSIERAIELRRALHSKPDLSGSEEHTARRLIEYFEPLNPDEIVSGLGGTGLAFVFNGAAPGPTLLLRCELDALPIDETGSVPHRSQVEGVSHLCGHDGHMAILAAVGAELSARPPDRGRVVLLYQPAEETGQGAEAILSDPGFEKLRPDLALALHNLPGFPLGQIVLRTGVFSSASRGATITLEGATAHAAQPEAGRSPAGAMCRIIDTLAHIPSPGSERAFVTVVGAQLGRRAFGTAPGHAEVWATLRSETDAEMDVLITAVEEIAEQEASRDDLEFEVSYEQDFACTVNAPRATQLVRRCAGDLPVVTLERPFPWSEDFGRFTAATDGALFGIGAGRNVPDLHAPDYDFPDELVTIGASLFDRITRAVLSEDSKAPAAGL